MNVCMRVMQRSMGENARRGKGNRMEVDEGWNVGRRNINSEENI